AGIAMIAPFQGDKSIVGAANFFPFRSGYPEEATALMHEAASTQKRKTVGVYQNVTYGPAMMQLIQDTSARPGVNVVAYAKLDATAPDKLPAIVKDALAEVAKTGPDSIIVLGGGRHTSEFLKQFKDSDDANAQIYLMSIVPQAEILKTLGEVKARGIVISQA